MKVNAIQTAVLWGPLSPPFSLELVSLCFWGAFSTVTLALSFPWTRPPVAPLSASELFHGFHSHDWLLDGRVNPGHPV